MTASRAASGAARGRRTGSTGGGRRHAGTAHRRRVQSAQLVVTDLIAVLLAVATAYWSRFGFPPLAGGEVIDLVAGVGLPLLWVAVAAANRTYDLRFVGPGTGEFGRLGKAFAQVSLAAALFSYLGNFEIARGFLLLALTLSLVLSALGRGLFRLRLVRLRRSGRVLDRVLLVGRAASLRPLVDAMRRDPAAGLEVVGVCLPADEAADPDLRRVFAEIAVPVVGDLRKTGNAVARCAASTVTVVAGDIGPTALRTMAWELEGSGADLVVSSGLSEVSGQRVHVHTVSGVPLLRVDTPSYAGFRRVLKGSFDRLAAGLALLLLSPALLVLGLLVRFTSRGPAFYRQERIGKNGVAFRMVKFRSMHVDADARLAELAQLNENADGLLFKMRDDPRVTPIGRWLRRFSLDELPQLFNILTGSMSLVGPRPPLQSEVALYGNDVARRLLVKPGLTGLWQVSGRSDLSWEDSVRLDLNYVENWSLGLDMRLLMKTAGVVVKATGAY
jgi:exopolysaccharide biosynthesis polyprenyl glycosylphosphotransferase